MPPSNRRIRMVILAVCVVVFYLWYRNSSSRHKLDPFYQKTVAKMNERMRGHEESPPIQADPNVNNPEGIDALVTEEKPVKEEEAAEHANKEQIAASPEGKTVKLPGHKKTRPKWTSDVKNMEDTKETEEKKSKEDIAIEAELDSILKRSPIIIFSKSYCPYSMRAKEIFAKYSISPAPFIVELDEEPLGSGIQALLHKNTGRRTVPNILINARSIGGSDEVAQLDEDGELIRKVKSMGGKRITEAKLKS